MENTNLLRFLPARKRPWNKGRLTGQKPPLQPKHVWAIRTRLQLANKIRDLALFNIAIDSKLRGCDVVRLRTEAIAPMGAIASVRSANHQAASHRQTCRPVRDVRAMRGHGSGAGMSEDQECANGPGRVSSRAVTSRMRTFLAGQSARLVSQLDRVLAGWTRRRFVSPIRSGDRRPR
jgi:hypothetical protein